MITPFDFLLFVFQKIAAAIKNESRRNATTDATTGTTTLLCFFLLSGVVNRFGLSRNLSEEKTDNKDDFNTPLIYETDYLIMISFLIFCF